LVLDVRGPNRDASRLLLRRRVDLVVLLERAAETHGAGLGQRGRQRGLVVVHVANRAHVHVGLGALELTLGHSVVYSVILRLLGGVGPPTQFFLTTASATLAGASA